MAIYGTGLLALCLLIGIVAGQLLGMLADVDANIGGVGIAMLLLIVASNRLRLAGRLSDPTRGGILFWSFIYIPIVVAMAASQNVRAALSGGPAAITAGAAAVVVCFALVPIISRIGRSDDVNRTGFDSADAASQGDDA